MPMQNVLERIIDGYTTKNYINKKILALVKYFEKIIHKKGERNIPANVLNDISKSVHLLRNLGYETKIPISKNIQATLFEPQQIHQWVASLTQNAVINNKRIVFNTGKMMDCLGRLEHNPYQDFYMKNAEILLKFIEINRKSSIKSFSTKPRGDQLWLEWCELAIFFCHHAVWTVDLRYLNTALKMNDWSLSFYWFSFSTSLVRKAHLLLALAEQENAFMELCKKCV